MAKIPLALLVHHCDQLLQTKSVNDWDAAVNGLQVENPGTVSRIAAIVDASLATIQLAIAAEADLMIVHHGLFWTSRQPWIGKTYAMLRLLIENDMALYSSHLPLDVHPKLGNNARLCAALGFKRLKPFFFEKGRFLGFQTRTQISRDALCHRLSDAVGGRPLIIPGGPAVCRRIGVVTGGAGGQLKTAASEGIDTFITGEGPHWTFAQAKELDLNVIYGGHYATETFGVKALADHLAKKFHLPWQFLDYPTGL